MSETQTPDLYTWDDEDGNIFAHGHVDPERFIEAAKWHWMDRVGDMEMWDDHYGEIDPAYVEHLWWLPASDDPEEECGTWHDEAVPGADPYTRYRP
jgi:hypothetical protein